MSMHATGWSWGDFNFDGKINVDDYMIIDSVIARWFRSSPLPPYRCAGFRRGSDRSRRYISWLYSYRGVGAGFPENVFVYVPSK